MNDTGSLFGYTSATCNMKVYTTLKESGVTEQKLLTNYTFSISSSIIIVIVTSKKTFKQKLLIPLSY